MTKKEKEETEKLKKLEKKEVPFTLPQLHEWKKRVEATDISDFPYAFSFYPKNKRMFVIAKCPVCGKIAYMENTFSIKAGTLCECGYRFDEEYRNKCVVFDYDRRRFSLIKNGMFLANTFLYESDMPSKKNLSIVKPMLVIDSFDEDMIKGYVWNAVYTTGYVPNLEGDEGFPANLLDFVPDPNNIEECEFLFRIPFKWIYYPAISFSYFLKSGNIALNMYQEAVWSCTTYFKQNLSCGNRNNEILNFIGRYEENVEMAGTEAWQKFKEKTNGLINSEETSCERFMYRLDALHFLNMKELEEKKKQRSLKKNLKNVPYLHIFDKEETQKLISSRAGVYTVQNRKGIIHYFNEKGECSIEDTCGLKDVTLKKLADESFHFVLWDYSDDLNACVYRLISTKLKTDNRIRFEIQNELRIFFSRTQMCAFEITNHGEQEISAKKIANSKFLKPNTAYVFNETNADVISTKEEIEECFKKSGLDKYGMFKLWEIDKYDHDLTPVKKPVGKILQPTSRTYSYIEPIIPYMIFWYDNPGIEKLLKAGLTNLLRYVLEYREGPETLEIKLKTELPLHKMLEVPKKRISQVQKQNMTASQFHKFRRLIQIDPNIKNEVWELLESWKILPDHIKEITTQHNISINQIIKYLESVRDYQCVEPVSAISIWTDYLGMARKIGYAMSKEKKYPDSLKREHDKALFAYKFVQEKESNEKFALAVQEYLDLEYKDANYSIIVPRSPGDVIREGDKLNHCVKQYVSRVTNHATKILFIRKNADLERPYFTMEVKDNEIIQIKGFSNCLPDSERMLNFIEKWAKKKNLILRCM